MAVYKENIIDIDLESGSVHRSFTNRFGFRCFRNGQPVSLVGSTVIGHFIRADGNTIQINGGAVTDYTAFVTLPASCYAVEGQFTLAIKLSGGGVTGTIRMVDGTVINTTNGAIIDPGSVIPDLTAYLDAVDDAIQAEETILGFTVEAVQIENTDDYSIVVTTVSEG